MQHANSNQWSKYHGPQKPQSCYHRDSYLMLALLSNTVLSPWSPTLHGLHSTTPTSCLLHKQYQKTDQSPWPNYIYCLWPPVANYRNTVSASAHCVYVEECRELPCHHYQAGFLNQAYLCICRGVHGTPLSPLPGWFLKPSILISPVTMTRSIP